MTSRNHTIIAGLNQRPQTTPKKEECTPSIRFICLSLAVFTCFMCYGYVLELTFTLDGMQEYGWFLTLLQFGFYTVFALTQICLTGGTMKRRIPMKTYILIAALTVGTMGFSNSSMGYLNYPTQVIFKSCKLIPVMLGSIIILKKSYNPMQMLACGLMSLGLIWFTLADTAVQPSFNMKGITLVGCALLCDAVIGNVQEGAMRSHEESPTLVVLYSYSIGFFIIFMFLSITGDVQPAAVFCLQHLWEVCGRTFLLSIAGFCGVQFVLILIREFGALAAVTVTTFRKALSICLSFIVFSKPFTIQYVWGGLLVALGIYLNIVFKNKSTITVFVALQKLVLKLKHPKIQSLSKSQHILNV